MQPHAEEEEEELLGQPAASTKLQPSGLPRDHQRRLAASLVDEDDDDKISFTVPSSDVLRSTTLRATRFEKKASAPTASPSQHIRSCPPEALTTDVMEEAERMRCDAPDDADTVGDTAAFNAWRERQALRERRGRGAPLENM